MRKLVALLAVLVVTVLARDVAAQNALVRDGGDFSVDLGPIGACMITPLELRRASLCAAMTPDAAQVPADTSERHVVALGVFRPRSGGVAVVGVYRITARSSEARSQADATRLMNEAATGVQKTIPAGARARASGARIVTVQHGAKAVRGDIDTDGLPASEAALQHIAMALINTESGAYAISLSGPSSARFEVDAALDSVLPSAFVQSPAHGPDLAYMLGYAIGAGFVLVVVIVAIVIAIVFATRRPPQPPPPPYGWR